MSLPSEVSSTFEDRDVVLERPAETYLSATGAYTIFNVLGGPVLVKALIGYITGAAVGTPTIATTLNTVAGQAAAVACNGAIGTIVWVPLNVAATLVNLTAQPPTDALFAPKGMIVGTQPTGPGLIVATYATATSLTMIWTIIYKRLSKAARIIVA